MVESPFLYDLHVFEPLLQMAGSATAPTHIMINLSPIVVLFMTNA